MKLLNMLKLSICVVILFYSNGLIAQHSSGGKTCVGTWKTIDDETGNARSHVQISKNGDTYSGKIIKLLNREPNEDKDPICTVCPGNRKNKKVVGMNIITGMKKERNRYAQGTILDPKKGKVYGCTMWMKDKNTLKVRGWYGPIYRTQTWYRID